MAFLKRVFSAAYRRALAAEAAGEYVDAARAYALAGERVKVGEMHLCLAERAASVDGRVTDLRTAARWAEGDGDEARAVKRRIARAMLQHVRQTGILNDGDRAILHEAATLFRSAGDWSGAGESLELAGDEGEAADAYQEAGEVDRLERVLTVEEDRRHRTDRLRRAFSEYELSLAAGARDVALARLRECQAIEPSGPARRLLEALLARMLTAGSVWLRLPEARRPTIYIGAFPLGMGREASCELPLRDSRVSRRHAEIVAHPGAAGGYLVRDCQSRNGTLLGAVRIAGELPLVGDGEIGLGDLVSVGFHVEAERIGLEVLRGADRGLRAVASTAPIALDGGAASLRFVEGRPMLSALSAAPPLRVMLNGARAGAEVQLILGDELELLDDAGASRLRLTVETPT